MENGKTEIRNQKIVELFKSGKTIKEIGKIFLLTSGNVRNILLKTGNYKATNKQERIKRNDEIIKLYAEKLSFEGISQKMNLSVSKIKYVLKANGVNTTGIKTIEKRKKIYELCSQGMPYEEIGIKVNLTSERVRQILVELGVSHTKKMVDRNNKILELYKKGENIKGISEIMNISHFIIRSILFKADIYKPNHDKIERNNKIVKLFNNGESTSSIAKILILHINSVRKILIDKGIFNVNNHLIIRNKKIADLYVNGWSKEKIASELDLSARTIRDILNKNGLYVSMNFSKEKQKERNIEICKFYKKERDLKKIALKFNLSQIQVRRILIKNDIFQSSTRNKIERNKKIINFYLIGESLKIIAEKLNLSRFIVWDVLNKNGVYDPKNKITEP